MLEVPGMTRELLDAMRPRTVAALRWGLFARALEPLATENLDAVATSLADAESEPSKATLSIRRARAREMLMQARIAQSSARTLLLLDEDQEGS
jgi:hypothetical protein